MWELITSLFCSFFGVCAETDACRAETLRGSDYTICSYSMTDTRIGIFLNDDDGRPYASLNRLMRAKPTLAFTMNGGMYHDDLAPVGLYVEHGQETKKISTKGGWGNFHLLPNGVFWVKGSKAGVTETKAYLRKKIRPDHATQSGPMLVIDGKLHPRFLKDSDSLKIRNGVGVSADGRTVHFVISKGAVTFWDFGKLFQKELKTPNALFLDGTISAMRTENFSQGGWRDLGPIIGVWPR